ncbi:hypothetical protein [Butyricimonas sp. Marseille-P3923]|uniref:hypothetical protein n=1 Tax=Butyricimonas sp. Marseille-P3923 TaxID=1987504 RepID=UPI000C07AAB8|nr:hypothetical protein [Butyricimonas sp. Marseille-P3923]
MKRVINNIEKGEEITLLLLRQLKEYGQEVRIGMFSTLSLNSVLSQMADHFFAGVVSIVGGVISSIVVARLKRR